MREPTAGPKQVQAFLERVAAGERQNGIEAVGCEAPRLVVDVNDAFAIDGYMRPHLQHQFHPFLARRRGEHLCAAKPGELHSERGLADYIADRRSD